MKVRELTAGEENSCRQRATAYVEKVKSGFTSQTSDSEKFTAFMDLYNKVAHGVDRCRENFQGDNYMRFSSNSSMACDLIKAYRQGVFTLEMICRELEGNQLTLVNGTSVEFNKCQALCSQQTIELARAVKTVKTKLLDKKPANDSTPAAPGVVLQ